MNNKLNICCFSRVNYWQGIKGGMDLHGKLLSEGMVNRGHSVYMISTRHPNGAEYEERNGVKIYYLKNTAFGSRRKGWKKESVNKFFELHQHLPFDLIWSQSFDAFGLTRLDKNSLKIPVVLTLHGSIQQEARTFKTNISFNFIKPKQIIKSFAGLFFSYFIAQKPLLNFSDKVITVSHQVTEDIRKWYGQKIANKCITIFNGIDTTLFRPDRDKGASIRSKYGVNEKDILLLSLGRLTYEKGHHLTVDVLKQLKSQNMNIKLMIVGDGVMCKSLKKNIRKEKLERDVILTGLVDNEETVQYYNSADIFLMPTLTVEGLPFVLLEAMSCAKPVVASGIGGNATIIEDNKNGLLIAPGERDKLAEKVKLLICNQDLAIRLSVSARRSVLDNFSVDQMVAKTLRVMESSIK